MAEPLENTFINLLCLLTTLIRAFDTPSIYLNTKQTSKVIHLHTPNPRPLYNSIILSHYYMAPLIIREEMGATYWETDEVLEFHNLLQFP